MAEHIASGSGVQHPLIVNVDGSVNIGSLVNNQMFDSSTNSVVCIKQDHHEIHDGNHYFFRGFEVVDSGAAITFSVVTPAGSKWVHLTYDIQGTSRTEFRVFEGGTISGATLIPFYNSNRNAPNNSIVSGLILTAVTVSGVSPTSGTEIEAWSRGLEGTNKLSAIFATGGRENELILQSGTTYLWEIKSVDDGNIIDYNALWYEHTDEFKKF